MSGYDLLSNLYDTKCEVYAVLFVKDVLGVKFEINYDVNNYDLIPYHNAKKMNVTMFKAIKKGVIKVWLDYECVDMDEFNDMVKRFNNM